MTNASWETSDTEVAGSLGPSRYIPVSNLDMSRMLSQGQMMTDKSRIARVEMPESQFTALYDIMPRTSYALLPDGQNSVPVSAMPGYLHTAAGAPAAYLPAQQYTAPALSIPEQCRSPLYQHPHSLMAAVKQQNPSLEVNMPVKEYTMGLHMKEDTTSSAPLMVSKLQDSRTSSTHTPRQQYSAASLTPMYGYQSTTMAGHEKSYPPSSHLDFYQSKYELVPQLADTQHQRGLSQYELRQYDASGTIPRPTNRKGLSSASASAAPQSSRSLPDPLRMRSSVIGVSKPSLTSLTQLDPPPYRAVLKPPSKYGEHLAMQVHQEKQPHILNSSQPHQTTYSTGTSFDLRQPDESKMSSASELLTVQRVKYEKEASPHPQLTTNDDLIPIQTIAERDQTMTKQSQERSKILVPGKRIKTSYLTAQGERVVILESGIGKNATFGGSQWQPPNGEWTGETQQIGKPQEKPHRKPQIKPQLSYR